MILASFLYYINWQPLPCDSLKDLKYEEQDIDQRIDANWSSR